MSEKAGEAEEIEAQDAGHDHQPQKSSQSPQREVESHELNRRLAEESDPYEEPGYTESITDHDARSDDSPSNHTEEERILHERREEATMVESFFDQWEIDSDGHWQERSPSPVSLTYDFSPTDLDLEEENATHNAALARSTFTAMAPTSTQTMPRCGLWDNRGYFKLLPVMSRCRWCNKMSLINKPTSPFWPCVECINNNNATLFSNKALPVAQIGRKTTADVARTIAAYFVQWHNVQALWRRRYLHLIMAMKFWELSKGTIDPMDPMDPMELIVDMLYPEVGPGVSKEELDEMPPPIFSFAMGRLQPVANSIA